jgi:hypothetical protein
LKKELKDATDVEMRTLELAESIDKLNKDIESAVGKIQQEFYQPKLTRVIKNLKDVNALLDKKHKIHAELDGKFKQVKAERKKIFNVSLEKLNEGLNEFCMLGFEQEIIANLEATNDDEPYNGEVTFSWQSVDNIDTRVTEISQNYALALALFFAILKLKKQTIVILNDATKNISADLEAFFKQQTFIQVISLTSRISDEKSDYAVRSKSQSFVVNRMAR